MTATRDIADNLEMAAQDLVEFIIFRSENPARRKKHLNNLIAVITKAKTKYSESWCNIMGLAALERMLIHPISRVRGKAIAEAEKAAMGCESDEQFTVFTILASLLKNGNCESTSIDTYILDELMKLVTKYRPLHEDRSFKELKWFAAEKAKTGVRNKLRHLFVAKAETKIDDLRKASTPTITHKQVEATSKIVPKTLKIDDAFKEELAKKLMGGRNENSKPIEDKIAAPKPVARGKKLNAEQLKVQEKLKGIYGNSAQPVKTVNVGKIKNDSELMKKAALLNFGLFGVKEPVKVGSLKQSFAETVAFMEANFGGRKPG